MLTQDQIERMYNEIVAVDTHRKQQFLEWSKTPLFPQDPPEPIIRLDSTSSNPNDEGQPIGELEGDPRRDPSVGKYA